MHCSSALSATSLKRMRLSPTLKATEPLDTSNRYFTPKDGKSDIEDLPLGDEVDPHGFLVKAAGGAYVHTGDNKVCYYKKVVSKGGEPLFYLTTPQTFQEGDIVEIQVSFIVIPLRDQKSRMSVVLQTISLLDGQFTQEVFIKGIVQEDVPQTKPKPSLKRRVGYSEEEVSVTQAKLAAMAIDEEEVQEELLITMG
ncbi:hypothetical protein BYT27DRAFT_7261397 [Phlegmacium glaucopus]|nr:hypothetical protein BYT27DRAFT_7261397 [Phlegmacium glaucopus]